ncbi:MAG: hypothetical protein EOP11_01220 [Proteobacteria bacterium]|nr:MAG: hypothetical protein EOP11_01220 [Pseudomonadota bacterium]
MEAGGPAAYQIGLYGKLGAPGGLRELKSDLLYFFSQAEGEEAAPFFAVFQPDFFNEASFLSAIRAELCYLGVDNLTAHSDHAGELRYFFSLDGHAFTAHGLHSQSSDGARRFRYPTMVFHAEQSLAEAIAA